MENQSEYKPPNEYMNGNEDPEKGVPTANKDQIKSQKTPNLKVISNLNIALKSKTSFITCPYCNHQALTNTTEENSVINILCCVFTLGLGWLLWQCIRSRDFSFKNVKHTCRKCDAQLADYKAC